MPTLGLEANARPFALLVLVNAFVGAMVGMERTILPTLAEEEFALVGRVAILSFIVVFGISKALTNAFAGAWSDRFGRKPVLVAGWLVALPVPFLLLWAPSWGWVLFANLLLGVSQGLTWSTTVIMKIDLAGPARRGLAMGLNEFAGYLAVAVSAFATGALATTYGPRDPFWLGVGFAVVGSLLSVGFVGETRDHVTLEASDRPASALDTRSVVLKTSFTDPELSSVSQAGMVNNLNDGLAWGLFPMLYATHGLSLGEIGVLAAIYPAVWGVGQLFTGAASDRLGRKGFIVGGMALQAVGIALVAGGSRFEVFAIASVLLGAGTAMVYPTLLASIGDVAHPDWRASAVGVYRFWRDMGYAIGALLAGVLAEVFGVPVAIWTIAGLTLGSGVLAAIRMGEPLARASVQRGPG